MVGTAAAAHPRPEGVVQPYSSDDSLADQVNEDWSEPLRLLFTIPNLQVTVQVPSNTSQNHPFTEKWLQEHGNSMDQVYYNAGSDEDCLLPFDDLVRFLGPRCKTLEYEPLPDSIEAVMALTGLTGLYILSYEDGHCVADPWASLACLTNLKVTHT